MQKTKKRTVAFNMRLDSEVRTLLDSMVVVSGLSITDFVSQLIIEKGEQMMDAAPDIQKEEPHEALMAMKTVTPTKASKEEKKAYFVDLFGEKAYQILEKNRNEKAALKSFFKDMKKLNKKFKAEKIPE
jgi:hypothetical protein